MNRALMAQLKPGDPLAIYSSSSSEGYSFITNEHVQHIVHETTWCVYNIKSNDRLRLWSCYPIQVGEGVFLSLSKHTPDQIQHLLRWKSITWHDYLRDCSSLSKSQLDGITTAAKLLLERKMVSQYD